MSEREKLNVMQCRSTYTTGGGPDKTALLVAERANPERFNMVLMYMRGASDQEFQIASWARAKGLAVHEVLERGKLDLDNLKEINRLLRHYRIDIFHARDYKTCFIGFLCQLVNPRMKLVFTAHGWIKEGLKSRFYNWLNLVSLKRYHKILAVSKATRQIMVDSGIPEGEIQVIYNAIDVDHWRRDETSSTFRKELGIPERARVIGVVGRLSREKALDTTLAVAQAVIMARPDAVFVLVGDGPARQEVETEVAQLGLAGKVILTGFRKDGLNVYSALDLFLSTSLTEGIPNTVLEAMAMEVPVVHTAVGGVPEMIEDGTDGVLCMVGDVAGISKAVMEILDDKERAVALSRHARASVRRRFSFDARMKAIEAVYEQVAG